MTEKTDFAGGLGENPQAESIRSSGTSNVIDRQTIVIGGQKQMIGKHSPSNQNGAAQVEVIEENGTVTGILYKCRCGHQQKILFEFEE